MVVSRTVGRILRASVAAAPEAERRARVAELAAPGLFTGLGVAANVHGVAGYVRRAVGPLPQLPDDERVALEVAYEGALAAHLRVLRELHDVAAALDGTCPWLVVKGPVLTEPVHGRADLRGYGDLDVLVSPSALGAALEALEGTGAETLDRNWTLLARELRGQVHTRLRHGTVVDLHWDLLNDRSTRNAFRVPIAEMIERRRTVQVGALAIPTLDPEDTLLHLGWHTVLSGAHRLVWFKDIERAVAQGAHDWDELIRRARAWHVDLVMGTALARSKALLGGAIPSDVVRALAQSRTWRALVTSAAWVAPVERQANEGSVTRMVARSTRGTAPSSVAVLVRKAALQLRHRGDVSRRDRAAYDPEDPGSMLHQSGDQAVRIAFLAAVAREGK